jgi:hypothetical protein
MKFEREVLREEATSDRRDIDGYFRERRLYTPLLPGRRYKHRLRSLACDVEMSAERTLHLLRLNIVRRSAGANSSCAISRSCPKISGYLEGEDMSWEMRLGMLIPVIMVLSACVTPYKDPRSPDEQKAGFENASKVLVGKYRVVDTRHHYQAASEIEILQMNQTIMVRFLDKNNTGSYMVGVQCMGFYHEDRGLGLFCDTPKQDVSFFNIEKELQPRTIKSGALIATFAPLNVGSGQYLLSMSGYPNGRQFYYVLEKK